MPASKPPEFYNGVRVPTAATLRRYGYSLEDWKQLPGVRAGACEICFGLPKSGRLHIDHEHRPRWRYEKPESRKTAVRGAICWQCNARVVGRGVTVSKLYNGARYLASYEKRKPK